MLVASFVPYFRSAQRARAAIGTENPPHAPKHERVKNEIRPEPEDRGDIARWHICNLAALRAYLQSKFLIYLDYACFPSHSQANAESPE